MGLYKTVTFHRSLYSCHSIVLSHFAIDVVYKNGVKFYVPFIYVYDGFHAHSPLSVEAFIHNLMLQFGLVIFSTFMFMNYQPSHQHFG